MFKKYCVDQLNQHLVVTHAHRRLGRDGGGQSGLQSGHWEVRQSLGKSGGMGPAGHCPLLQFSRRSFNRGDNYLVRTAGEKPLLVASPGSLLWFNFCCTFQVEFMARSGEVSVVFLISLTLFPSLVLSLPKPPLPGHRALPSTLR